MGDCPSCEQPLTKSMKERVNFENEDGEDINAKVSCIWCPTCRYIERVDVE